MFRRGKPALVQLSLIGSQVARARLRYALMDEAVAQTAPISGASTNKAGWLVAIVLFGLLWLELNNQLKAEWWLNPQYN